MAWLIQATFMATIIGWCCSCGQKGEGTTLPPQSLRPRNITTLKAPRAPGRIGLGDRSERDQRKGQPLLQAPLGSPSSRATPASSPATCGGGHGGGERCSQPELPHLLARPWFPASFTLTGHAGARSLMGNHTCQCTQHGEVRILRSSLGEQSMLSSGF